MNVARILYIEEYYEGEYECRGEKYKTVHIYDLDKLNALSKKVIEERLLESWLEKLGDDISPMNGNSWSFEDIQEEIACGNFDSVEDEYMGELIINDIDFTKSNFQDKLNQLYKSYNDVNKYGQLVYEKALLTMFTEEELKSCRVDENIKFNVVVSVSFS